METLTAQEARVLGCLIEKQMTTPEYYPMTVNSLVAACNQRTNREPVVDFDTAIVERTLDSLDQRGLVGVTRVSGGRTLKYAHHANEMLQVDTDQLAILAVLLLRGAQTPGELRVRTDRYVAFDSVTAVEDTLRDLTTREVVLVERLDREPGQKENRYRTLLAEPSEAPSVSPAVTPPVSDLEERVATLEAKLGEILQRLDLEDGV